MTKCKDCLWWDRSSKESTFGLCVKSGDWNDEDYGPDCVEFADKKTGARYKQTKICSESGDRNAAGNG